MADQQTDILNNPPPPPAPGEPVDWDAAAAWVSANFGVTGHWLWPPGWEAFAGIGTEPLSPSVPPAPPPPQPGEPVDWSAAAAWVNANFGVTGHWSWPPGWEAFGTAAEPQPPTPPTPPKDTYTEYGDTSGVLADNQHGGDQTLPIGHPSSQPNLIVLYGDADVMREQAIGGNDTLPGGTGYVNNSLLVGDARLMTDNTRGGDDVVGGGSQGTMYGDAETMSGHAQGGNDTITGGGPNASRTPSGNILYGDAYSMSDDSRGGNDRLVGVSAYPGSYNALYGDAHTMSGHAQAGDDTLVAGSASRVDMWGDAAVIEGPDVVTGHDTFVPGGGRDIIHDFEPGKDVIDVTASADRGIHSFADLSPLITVTDTGSVITFAPPTVDPMSGQTFEHSTSVLGDFALIANDFLFA